jgi:hypothetical protein
VERLGDVEGGLAFEEGIADLPRQGDGTGHVLQSGMDLPSLAPEQGAIDVALADVRPVGDGRGQVDHLLEASFGLVEPPQKDQRHREEHQRDDARVVVELDAGASAVHRAFEEIDRPCHLPLSHGGARPSYQEAGGEARVDEL